MFLYFHKSRNELVLFIRETGRKPYKAWRIGGKTGEVKSPRIMLIYGVSKYFVCFHEMLFMRVVVNQNSIFVTIILKAADT